MLERARDQLRQHFGYSGFRAGQERAIGAVLARRDVLVVLPTGGGKSLCYQIPALLLPGLTVVVSPLISLMEDQVAALTRRGLPAAFVNSTLDREEAARRLDRAERGELKMLYVAPERFDAGGGRVARLAVSLLAVDEAHCISEWGHGFRPSYRRVGAIRDMLGGPPAIALTATATPEVRRDIIRTLGLRHPEVVVTGFDRPNLQYHVRAVRRAADKDAALLDAVRGGPGAAVVYAPTRRGVERLAGLLRRARVAAAAYHAGLPDARRQDIQQEFMTGRARVIVATSAFGMGVDKADVRLVVHHAMPGTLEAYYQEAGRAGRDGQPSSCMLLHTWADRRTHEYFIDATFPARAVVERIHDALRAAADAGGLARVSAAELARSVRGASARGVEAALRVLAVHGVARADPGSSSRVAVRLLAIPERIAREVADPPAQRLLRHLGERGRACAAGEIPLALDALPRELGGPIRCAELLAALQERQILVWRRLDVGFRLTMPAAAPIPWNVLAARRAGELGRLDVMERFATTPGCRRAYVLRYFGEVGAHGPCAGCDNCLRPPPIDRLRRLVSRAPA